MKALSLYNYEKMTKGGLLFLTNNKNALGLYNWIKDRCKVSLFNGKLKIEQVKTLEPNMIISYNYNYIIDDEIIKYMRGNIINLHISYLPWNRGFSPNIWSFIDNTPKGVTIHQVDAGLDTGEIMFQKELFFAAENENFVTTYNELNKAIVKLFKQHWEEIINRKYILSEQKGKGSYHTKKDLDDLKTQTNFQWGDNIAEFLNRYSAIK